MWTRAAYRNVPPEKRTPAGRWVREQPYRMRGTGPGMGAQGKGRRDVERACCIARGGTGGSPWGAAQLTQRDGERRRQHGDVPQDGVGQDRHNRGCGSKQQESCGGNRSAGKQSPIQADVPRGRTIKGLRNHPADCLASMGLPRAPPGVHQVGGKAKRYRSLVKHHGKPNLATDKGARY